VTDQGVIVLGIPVPSSSPVFLAIIAIHIAAGIVCVVAGVFAMLAPKQPGRHPTAGTIYYWSLVVVFVTMSTLTILRWPADNALAVLGLGSFVAGSVGRRARQRMRPGWPTVHVTGMAVSFILLLTAFYVDNGPNLPLWRSLPHVTYWLLPSAIGLPLLAWALLKHPVVVHERENDGH
jgi:uncharacterized protein YjeT (DUF2065 family)